jgi:hypothetical protein
MFSGRVNGKVIELDSSCGSRSPSPLYPSVSITATVLTTPSGIILRIRGEVGIHIEIALGIGLDMKGSPSATVVIVRSALPFGLVCCTNLQHRGSQPNREPVSRKHKGCPSRRTAVTCETHCSGTRNMGTVPSAAIL